MSAPDRPAPRFGFPVHAPLGWLSFGALAAATAFDVVSHAAPEPYTFPRPAFWLIALGLVAGVGGGLPGLADLLRSRHRPAAFRAGCWHVGLTDGALALYGLSLALRVGGRYDVAVPPGPLATSLVAAALLLAGGVAGARLTWVHRLGGPAPAPPADPPAP